MVHQLAEQAGGVGDRVPGGVAVGVAPHPNSELTYPWSDRGHHSKGSAPYWFTLSQ
jgi:hypothetical protein